jgi:RNA polymerase sigma-70 factor (ECF subfamily)
MGDHALESEETALAQRAIGGSRAAFDDLVRRTARSVYAELLVLTGDRDAAEDLVQETYLRAWKGIGNLAEAEKFRGWLYAIARTAVFDAHRSEGRKKRSTPVGVARSGPGSGTGDETASAGSPPADAAAEHHESQARALDALAQLPALHRRALTLRYLDQADYARISRDLGISNGSLRGVLTRGLEMLRESLTERGRS